MPPNGTKNLIPQNMKSPEERKEIGRKGGKASGVARRRKKELKELLQIAMSIVDEETGLTKAEMLVASMMNKAIENGDVKAAVFVRDTMGEKPVDKTEVISNDIRIKIEEETDDSAGDK